MQKRVALVTGASRGVRKVSPWNFAKPDSRCASQDEAPQT